MHITYVTLKMRIPYPDYKALNKHQYNSTDPLLHHVTFNITSNITGNAE